MYGTYLKNFASQTKNFQKRDCFTQIQEYLYSDTLDKVCLVYGLRRTGKTTMLRQCLNLFDLYEKKELTGAINRIIENESHKFLVQILTDDFKSYDLYLLGRNLRKERIECFEIKHSDEIVEELLH